MTFSALVNVIRRACISIISLSCYDVISPCVGAIHVRLIVHSPGKGTCDSRVIYISAVDIAVTE